MLTSKLVRVAQPTMLLSELKPDPERCRRVRGRSSQPVWNAGAVQGEVSRLKFSGRLLILFTAFTISQQLNEL